MDDIDASEEWVLETPPPSRNLNMNESINTSPKLSSVPGNKSPPIYGKTGIYKESEEEWIVETPPNFSTFQINDVITSFQEKSTLKSVPMNEITLINENNKSEDRMFSNRSALNTNNLNRTLEEERILDTHSCCNTNETNRVCEERCRKSSRKSHFEPCANSKLHGKRCARSRNNLTNSKLKKMNELHENKFVNSYFNSDGNNNGNSNVDRGIYKRTFNRKPIHSLKDIIYESNENRFINLPYRFVNKSDQFKGGEKKWKPNIEAPEFVPESMKRLKSEFNTEQFSPNSSTYSHFSLKDLLNYDMDLMPSELLMDYANALKLRVLEQIFEFEPSFRDELKVLCQLIDGDLTDRNKRIVSLRICTLVERTVLNKPQRNQGRY